MKYEIRISGPYCGEDDLYKVSWRWELYGGAYLLYSSKGFGSKEAAIEDAKKLVNTLKIFDMDSKEYIEE